MYNKKSLTIIGIFTGIFLFVVYIALTAQKRRLQSTEASNAKLVERAYFTEVHYFKLNDRRPNIELQSNSLEIIDNTFLNFENPRGLFFSSDAREVHYSAKKGFMNQDKKLLDLVGEVHLSDPNSNYASDKLVYDGKKEVIRAQGDVSSQKVDEKTADIIKIHAQSLVSYLDKQLTFLKGGVEGEIIRKRRYEPGLSFTAEEAELNSPESQLNLVKSVKILRNNYYLQAGKAEIFLENYNKKLKYYVLYDDVKLEETLKLESGKTQIRRAYAEKLEGHQRTEKVILTGAPRVEQGNDIIKGYQITLRENVELVEVDDAQSSFKIKRDDDE